MYVCIYNSFVFEFLIQVPIRMQQYLALTKRRSTCSTICEYKLLRLLSRKVNWPKIELYIALFIRCTYKLHENSVNSDNVLTENLTRYNNFIRIFMYYLFHYDK